MANRKRINKKKETVENVSRPIRIRRYNYYFLIVCEDENTEPTYFRLFKNKFPDRTLYLETIGAGRDPYGVVEQSIKERNELEKRARKKIDKVWVVFDKDDAELSKGKTTRFNNAFRLASKEIINIALSNEVFELWLLLHFEDVNSNKPIPRKEIYDKLEAAIKNNLQEDQDFTYEHGKSSVIDFTSQYGDEEKAIDRSKALRKALQDKDPINKNPSTDVDLLVTELREWIEYFNYQP